MAMQADRFVECPRQARLDRVHGLVGDVRNLTDIGHLLTRISEDSWRPA
jgi:hypothetical protein